MERGKSKNILEDRQYMGRLGMSNLYNWLKISSSILVTRGLHQTKHNVT